MKDQPGLRVGAVVPSLTRWGLSADADLIYRTLLSFGPKTAATLRKELGMPARRLMSALDMLRSASAVAHTSATRSSDRIWRAQPAEPVITALRRRPQPPAIPFEYPLLGEGFIHLPSRELARQRLSVLSARARRQQLTMNPEPSFDSASLRAGSPLDRALLDRGVQLRVLGVQVPDEGLLGSAPGPRLGYRSTPTVPMKLVLLDQLVALFPVDPNNYDRGYLEVHQPSVVRSLSETFERHWSQAEEPWEQPLFVLTPRETALIGLLVSGHTDASAAGELRISERSVTNILRSLMDRLGVDNRFQLGVALGALRITPPPPGTPRGQNPTLPEGSS